MNRNIIGILSLFASVFSMMLWPLLILPAIHARFFTEAKFQHLTSYGPITIFGVFGQWYLPALYFAP